MRRFAFPILPMLFCLSLAVDCSRSPVVHQVTESHIIRGPVSLVGIPPDTAGLSHVQLVPTATGQDLQRILTAMQKQGIPLVSLNLYGCRNITDQDLKSALKGQDLSRLTSVNLGGTKVTDDGLKSLRGAKINVLVLADTAVTGKGLRYLEGQPIEYLVLFGSKFTGAQMEQLASFKSLRQLYLNQLPISGVDLKYLTGLTELRELSLRGCPVNDQDIMQLTSLPLKRVNLYDTPVTKAGMMAFKTSLDSRHNYNSQVLWDWDHQPEVEPAVIDPNLAVARSIPRGGDKSTTRR